MMGATATETTTAMMAAPTTVTATTSASGGAVLVSYIATVADIADVADVADLACVAFGTERNHGGIVSSQRSDHIHTFGFSSLNDVDNCLNVSG